MKKSSPQATPRPDLWAYRDARQFVADCCAWRQQTDRHFSYRKLARLASMASPGYVQTFVSGQRNLKSTTGRDLAVALGLQNDEVDFFVTLLQFTQAESANEKTGYYEQLLRQSVRHGAGTMDAARLAYFTEWYVPVIHAMASLKGFRAEPEWIGRRVLPRIRPAEATRALEILRQLELIAIDGPESVRVLERVVDKDPNFQNILIREYHRAMIRLGERAIDMLRGDDRSINGFTVTVPRDRLPQVKAWTEELLRELFYRILALQDGNDVEGEVVQCNMQAFRMTDLAV